MVTELTDEAVEERERAGVLRGEFIVARNRALTMVSRERETMNGAVKKLRTKYEKLTAQYLRFKGTTYAAWLESGPKLEWEEVLEATRDPSIWDRLVERHAAPANDGAA